MFDRQRRRFPTSSRESSRKRRSRDTSRSTPGTRGATARSTCSFLCSPIRFARERLKALAQMEGLMVKEMPEVLFVCVHNAGRSQMAAGLVKLRSQGRIHVRSAGSDPGEEVNPAVVAAMQEIGVDIERGIPEATRRRSRASGRRGDHDGLRRCLPISPASDTRTGRWTIQLARSSRPCA